MALGGVRDALGNGGYGRWLSVFAIVAAFVVINSLQPWGYAASMAGEVVLQASACLAAVGASLVSARRVAGRDRSWRVLVALAMGCWLAAQAAWWWHLFVHQGGPPTPKVAAALHVGFLLLALAALVALAASTAGSGAARERWTTHAVVVLVLDGLVAAAAYAVLVWSSRTSGGGSSRSRAPAAGRTASATRCSA